MTPLSPSPPRLARLNQLLLRLGLVALLGTTSSIGPAHGREDDAVALAEAARAWAPIWVTELQSRSRSEYLTAVDFDGNTDVRDNASRAEMFATPSVVYWWGERRGDLVFLGYAGYRLGGAGVDSTRWIGVLLHQAEPEDPQTFLAVVLPRAAGRYQLGIERHQEPATGPDLTIGGDIALHCDLGCVEIDFVRDELGLHPVVGRWDPVESYCDVEECTAEYMDLTGASISPGEHEGGRPHPNDRRLLPELKRPRGDSVVYWHTGVETLTSTPDRAARGLLAHNGEVTPYGLRAMPQSLVGAGPRAGNTEDAGLEFQPLDPRSQSSWHPLLGAPFTPLGSAPPIRD